MTTPTKSFRPWRIIAAFVALMLAVGGLQVFESHKSHAAVDAAVNEIAELGGYIEYEFVGPSLLMTPGIVAWLERFGIRCDRIRRVRLYGDDVNDDTLKHVGQLTTLEGLHVASDSITDEGLRSIAQLTNLEVLVLSGKGITDQGLVHLCGLKNLRKLGLPSNQRTDNYTEHLESLTKLEIVYVVTRFTENSLNMRGIYIPD